MQEKKWYRKRGHHISYNRKQMDGGSQLDEEKKSGNPAADRGLRARESADSAAGPRSPFRKLGPLGASERDSEETPLNMGIDKRASMHRRSDYRAVSPQWPPLTQFSSSQEVYSVQKVRSRQTGLGYTRHIGDGVGRSREALTLRVQ